MPILITTISLKAFPSQSNMSSTNWKSSGSTAKSRKRYKWPCYATYSSHSNISYISRMAKPVSSFRQRRSNRVWQKSVRRWFRNIPSWSLLSDPQYPFNIGDVRSQIMDSSLENLLLSIHSTVGTLSKVEGRE